MKKIRKFFRKFRIFKRLNIIDHYVDVNSMHIENAQYELQELTKDIEDGISRIYDLENRISELESTVDELKRLITEIELRLDALDR